MERAAWTDQRLDDLAMRTDADIRDLREEMRGLRAELRSGFSKLRGEIDALRVTMLRVGGGVIIGLVGVIAAVVASG